MLHPLPLLALALALAGCAPRPAERTTDAAATGAAQADTSANTALPAEGAPAGQRRLVYVPVYSHIYFRDPRRTVNLAATLSIRNTDPGRAITLTAVRYYDNDGRLVRSYLPQPVRLGPMASTAHVVEEDDTSGGVGANFLVEWTAAEPVSEPLVEAVMINTTSAQGISFTSRGVALVRR